jgi:hypothetical protein
MMFKKALILLPLIALVAASCNKNQTANTDTSNTTANTDSTGTTSGSQSDQNSAAIKPTSLTVNLLEQNNSKETGTATISENNGQLTVVLNMTGAPKGVAQPAHIHSGSCAELGDIKYPLNTPTNGVSTTTIDNLTITDLLGAPMAINVHKSTTQPNIYVACGDILYSAPGTGTGLPTGL